MNAETRTCQNCKNQFVIEPEDFNFYEKIKVPPPTFCFQCRLQRRMTWRNERALYKRDCDLCKKSTFSMYPAGVIFSVYCHDCWFSDKWDPMQYGRDYNFSENFFVQFHELMQVVPRIALQVENVVNCDYTNQILDCKNCYLITSGIGDEDCMFCYRVNYSKNVLDSFGLRSCENVYEGLLGRESANIFFSRGFADSVDLYYCDEPRGCQNCFMGANLRRKSYVFRGEQLTPQNYKEKITGIDFGSYQTNERLKKEFNRMVGKSLHPRGTFKNTVNTSGDALANTKDCYYCFYGSNLENCRYCLLVDDAKDCMDMNNGGHIMELIYEMNTTGARAFNSKFCNDAWPEVNNLTYCDSCRSGVRDLFGCISLRSKQYCILNRQYTKEDYESLVEKIREHMSEVSYADKRGIVYKYGEFFPSELSPFPYNDSMAQDFFPLTSKEAKEQSSQWNEKTEKNVNITVPTNDLPDNIKDVKDEITAGIVGCAHQGKCNDRCTVGFKIVPTELQFYRRFKLPLPRLCPNCRHYQRLKQRNPLKLWRRQCSCDYKVFKNSVSHSHHPEGRCPNEFETSYSPERPEIVYCEQCYNAEIV